MIKPTPRSSSQPLNGALTEADALKQAGSSSREPSPTRADAETNVDFPPASGVKQLLNIKPQHITVKPAHWRKRDQEPEQAGRVTVPYSSRRSA